MNWRAAALLLVSATASASPPDAGKLNCRVFAFAHLQGQALYDNMVAQWLLGRFMEDGDQKAQLLLGQMTGVTLDGLSALCSKNQSLTLDQVYPTLRANIDRFQFSPTP